jgi:DNA gyrase subunit B
MEWAIEQAEDRLRRRREKEVSRQSATRKLRLPGKLADCTIRSAQGTEIFIVEGDSAGGSAKSARKRETQAILPLRGKILNVEKARFDKMLRSEAIQTLITAIGAGIGADDFDIAKVRYHKIVVMTDADVDGAHIRTLLLTFFYRQMKEIIDRGFLYIAQPPLFKVKRGRSEWYVKDEASMNKYLLEQGASRASLLIEERRITGKRLEAHIQRLGEFLRYLNTFQRHNQDCELIKAFALYRRLSTAVLANREELEQDIQAIAELYKSRWRGEDEASIAYEILMDELYDRYKVEIRTTDKHEPLVLDRDFLSSHNYRELRNYTDLLETMGVPPYQIEIDSKLTEVETLSEVVDTVLNAGKSGLSIQRYKGLGEMNPEQLWETTMDPQRRTFLQVEIGDLEEVETMFTTLMGDQVEPRREFIQKHATQVKNLDV